MRFWISGPCFLGIRPGISFSSNDFKEKSKAIQKSADDIESSFLYVIRGDLAGVSAMGKLGGFRTQKIIALARGALLITALAATLSASVTPAASVPGKIQHVIVIMQENRSFDHYFGTYPGAEGLSKDSKGNFTACLPQNDPAKPCVPPFHDRYDYNNGSAHFSTDSSLDVDNGKMDGFVIDQEGNIACTNPDDPRCTGVLGQGQLLHDVMGFHDRNEIPNYWAYADHFRLQDHLFAPSPSWSLINHLYMVSAWAANCTNPADPMSCTSSLGAAPLGSPAQVTLSWNGSSKDQYRVKRSTWPGHETPLQTLSPGQMSFIDYTLTNGVTYYYEIAHLNPFTGAEDEISNEVSVTNSQNQNQEVVTISATATSIGLSWPAFAGARGYNIKRGTAAGNETFLACVNGLTYTDNSVIPGTRYFYVITANFSTGETAPSAQVSATAGTPALQVMLLGGGLESASAWTETGYLLDRAGVPWKYYLGEGTEPDCEDDQMTCAPVPMGPAVPGIWNPFLLFTTVAQKAALDNNYVPQHIVNVDQFFVDVRNGTLPAVSWIVPDNNVSEHPPSGVQEGMEYVTSLINAIMETGLNGYTGVNYWQNTAIFLSWDDWGGFYDHVEPPIAVQLSDGPVLGYGIRVPGLIISPMLKGGLINKF